VLAGAWAALVVAAGAFVIGFLQGGLVLLYVAIAASAISMTLVVGYLLRTGGPREGRRIEAAGNTEGTTTGPGSG
jgi:hypothetical protein